MLRRCCSVAAIATALFLAPARLPGQGANTGLSITGYQLISQERYTRTQWYVTYKADLMNTGPLRSAVTATVTSSAPGVQVVTGKGILHFSPVPANARVTSADAFVLLVDYSTPFDLSNLAWSFLNPTASAGPDQTVRVGSTVILNGGGSVDPGNSGTLTYFWALESRPAFSQAALLNPGSLLASIVVDVPGSYSISLTVSNGLASDKALVRISTTNSPPIANAGPNQSVPLNATVKLNGSLSSDVDGDQLTYLWMLVSRPAGSTAELANLRSVTPAFVADKAGTYIARLVVNDGSADSLPVTVTVTVGSGNTPPVANAGPGQIVTAGSLVQLTGAGSTDIDGDSLTYKWSLLSIPPGSAAALSNPAKVDPTFTADVAGTYVAQLIVSDGKIDSAPSTVSIATNPSQLPTANAGPNQTVAHGALVNLNGSGNDAKGLPLTWMWSLIARPAGSLAVLSAANIPNPTFIADQPGTYVAQLQVSNGAQTSAPASVTITTTNTPPVANAGADQTVSPGVTVFLTGKDSSDADHDPLTYTWALTSRPAGSTTVLQGMTTVSPTFLADVAGTYVAQLIVSDGFTTGKPATVTITAGSSGIKLSPNPLNLVNASGVLYISLSSPAPPGGIFLSIASKNPSVAAVRSSVYVGETASVVGVMVSSSAPGSTEISVSGSGLGTATATVISPPPGSIALAGPATIGLSQTGTVTVTLSAPAPPNGLTVQLASSDSTKVRLLSNTLYIPAGATSPAIPPQFATHNVGAASIVASAPGYISSAPLVINVTAVVTWITQNATITGVGNQTFLVLRLNAIAPGAPGTTTPVWQDVLFVNLSSSDTTVATIQATGVFIWDGSTAPGIAIPVTAIGPGKATIHASGVNIPDVTTTVTVTM